MTSDGTRFSFSSVGSTVDGRIKPDVMAMGSGVVVASGTNPKQALSGPSFSCPRAAGVCALILSAHPQLNPFQVREDLRNTVNNAVSPNNQSTDGELLIHSMRSIIIVPVLNIPR